MKFKPEENKIELHSLEFALIILMILGLIYINYSFDCGMQMINYSCSIFGQQNPFN